MDKYSQSEKKLLEMEFYQLKQKQALCNSLINLLKSRAQFLQNIIEDLDEVKDCLSSVNDDLQAFLGELEKEAPVNACERLDKLRRKMDDCDTSLKEEMDNVSTFLNDNFMMCEEISSEIESVSQRIHEVQHEHQSEGDQTSNDQKGENGSD